MNKFITFTLCLILISSCTNKGRNVDTFCKNSDFEFDDYFNTNSYFLVYYINETKICEICALQTLNRLSYLRNFGIKVFIDGISYESSTRFPDFDLILPDINYPSEGLANNPFICLVDSIYTASDFFVPELDQPQKFENYLNNAISKIKKEPDK